jgi:small subunit ribosomal protein S4
MKLGPQYKICKRLGSAVFEKCQTQKFLVSEARSQKAGKFLSRGGSDYRKQLIEKQKARFAYGITETQLKRYAKEASEAGGNIVESLLGKLEGRLDNVVYRLGLTSTRRAARQLVAHGHITLNGKRVTSPAHLTHVGDVVGVREGSRSSVLFQGLDEKYKEYRVPQWLAFESKKFEGKRTGTPTAGTTDINANLAAVFEFYSR